MSSVSTTTDVVLIGGGIMSATLGTLLQHVQPEWSITLYERLDEVARESSGGWNNAGTGHAAYCELNYTPEKSNGEIDVTRALTINEQFHLSRQLWASLVEREHLSDPDRFIHSAPHMVFVSGEDDVSFLRRRHAELTKHALFEEMTYSESVGEIADQIPLMFEQRTGTDAIATTRSDLGTDVDFGELTRQLVHGMQSRGAQIRTRHAVESLEKQPSGLWKLTVKNRDTGQRSHVLSKFVFVGAGGQAIQLLQQSGIPEVRGFAGFPVSGQFLQCTNPELIARHNVKVYGKPHLGAPPMSAPHLDTRIIDGTPGLLFGPYAGFSPKLLKHGGPFDFFGSIRPHNILTMLSVAKDEIPLTKYLIGQVLQSQSKRVDALREFIPSARNGDWKLIHAGQRVQVMKPSQSKRGVLQFGTELICSADGTIAGLLGASPGASTGTAIMLDLMRICFPRQEREWAERIRELIPSFGTKLNANPALLEEMQSHTDRVLKLTGDIGVLVR